MRRFVWTAVAAMALSFAAHADGVSQGQEIAARAAVAEKEGRFAEAAEFLRQALVHRPNHPGLTYRLAATSIRAGRNDDAIKALSDYAAMGLVLNLDNPNFAPVANDPRLAAIRAQVTENAKPKGAASIAATIAEPQLIGEGLAIDETVGRIFVGSVHKRKVVAVTNGAASDFVPSARDGVLGVFGLRIDRANNSLWAAASALPQVGGLAAGEKGAGLFEFDLKTAALKRKALLTADGKEHVIGDLVLAASGEIYASDSVAPVIYRLRPGQAALEELARSDTFHSLQGLALSADGKKLAVADYSSGIHLVDVATGKSALLDTPKQTTLLGLDAVLRHGRDLIAVQNGVNPQRIVRLRMNTDWSAIERLDVIAANLLDLEEPTLAVVSGSDLLVIGNGQWSLFGDDGSVKPGAEFAPTKVLRIALPAPR